MPIRLDEIPGEEQTAPQPAASSQAQPTFSPYPGMQLQGVTLGGKKPVVRFGRSPTPQASFEEKEASATRRQLLRKAADQKLQLEQAIGLFTKIYDEAESDVPVIEHPEGTLPLQQLGRFAGQKLGFREKQRGTITSLQARATPALKSLGEVGVLTNQDIERMLRGGFPADDDTTVSRGAKREGIISDLQMKLDQVNSTLAGSGLESSLEQADPNIERLQQQFPGAVIRRKQ